MTEKLHRPVHRHAFPSVPGINGQNMAITWQGPGPRYRPIRKARPTGGRVIEARADGSYATSRAERRRIAKRNRTR